MIESGSTSHSEFHAHYFSHNLTISLYYSLEESKGSQSGQSGQRRNYLMREISSGSFERTITFARPVEADQVETSYENGILTVNLPISASSRPRRINVSSGSSQGQVQAPQSTQSAQPSSSQTTQSSTGTPIVGTDPTNTNV